MIEAKKAPPPEEKAPPPARQKSSAPDKDDSDPGPFRQVDAHAVGPKVHLNIQDLAWSNEFDLGNDAYAHQVAKAIQRVNDDFSARRPKPKGE